MIVREPETNTDAPFLGKEGSALLDLWMAQVAWLSTTMHVSGPEPGSDHEEPAPSPQP
jgi:hypothetical protein